MRKRWLRVVALLVLIVGGWALINRIWMSNGFDGVVVAPSGTPVQGAVVLATWQLSEPRGGSFVAVLNLFETTTDSNGRFRIPGWGPRFWVRSWAYMDYAEPRIHVIEPRFVPLSVATGGWPKAADRRIGDATPLQRSLTITMAPTSSIPPSQLRTAVDEFVLTLGTYEYHTTKCLWHQTPRFLRAIRDLEAAQTDNRHFARLGAC